METQLNNRVFNQPTKINRSLVPVYDVNSVDNGYDVTVELPGLNKDQIHVETKDKALHVWTESKDESTKDFTVHLREFNNSDYELKLRLNDKINPEGIKASYQNGLLNLQLPFAEEAKPREITIN